MTIIPLTFKIQRASNGKKEYIDIKTGEASTDFKLKWQDVPKGYSKLSPSYAIRPDDDLVVIDCDSLETTQAMDDVTPYDPDQYIVISDKGEKHYYYTPTQYYKDSLLGNKTSRVALGKIDVLHGSCLVFTACPLNSTKSVLRGSLQALTPIPDVVVDYLVSLMQAEATSSNSDYAPVLSFMGPQLTTALSLYARSKSYIDLQGIFQMLTPSKFKTVLEPDSNPARVPHGQGTEYVQALIAKLGRDPSISLEDTVELLTIAMQQLRQPPWPDSKLRHHIDYITKQRYPNGQPVFVYDPNALAKPMVSINKFQYMPVYRTLDDNYIIAKAAGGVEVIKGISNFKKAMASPNYSLLVNKEVVKNQSFMSKAAEMLETVTISDLPYKPVGPYIDNDSLYYNIYKPTKFLGIIRGEYLQDLSYIEGSTPTIDAVLGNICKDHPPESLMAQKLTQFIAHKLKTLAYSPIVFHIKGNRGTGKNMLINILKYITESTQPTKFSASNSHFTGDIANKMWLYEDEGLATKDVVNTLKAISGNEVMRIEFKGKDATTAKNISTLIFNANFPTPLAETRDDRRFVTISSFTAERLNIKDIQVKLALELEQWCLKLRDTRLSHPSLYTDANMWHDSIHYDAFEAKGEHSHDSGTRLANIMYKLDTIDGPLLKASLEEIFGVGMHYKLSRTGHLMIYLWHNKNTVRLSDNNPVPHTITKYDCEKAGIGMHVKEDKNFKTYNTRINYLKLELGPQQAEVFAEDSVAPLEID